MTRIQRTAAKSAAGKGSYTFAFTARPFPEKTQPLEIQKCVEVSGSAIIKVPSTMNVCVGLAVSGTGIPAATTIKEVGHEGATLKPNELELNNKATESGEFTLKFSPPGGGFKTLGGKEGTETTENQYLILNQVVNTAESSRGSWITSELLIPKKVWNGEIFGFRSAIQAGTILKLTSSKEPGNEALTMMVESVEEQANGLYWVKGKAGLILAHSTGHTFEGSIAAGELGVIKEITSFISLGPGSVVTGPEAIAAEPITIVQSVNESAKTAVIFPVAKEELKKSLPNAMTAFQPWPTGNEELLITTEFATHVTESEFVKLGGRSTTQEVAGAETKAEAEAKSFNLVPFAGSTPQLRIGAAEVILAAFTNGMEITAGGLKITGAGKLEVTGGESILGGTTKPTSVQLSQLAFPKINTPAELKNNVLEYEAPNVFPTVWQRLRAKPNLAFFGIKHIELPEGKVFIFTNVGTNPIDIAGENTECPTAEYRFKIKANTGSNNFEATIAAGALTELKEITNFRFLYTGSKVTDSGGVIKAGTTISSINVEAKTAIMSEAATGEHAKEVMTASFPNIATIGVDESVWIGYDTKSLRWRVIGGPSG